MTTHADEPDKAWPRYRVAFHIYSGERGVRLGYAVSYVRNPKTGEGFVYLPGPGEADYRLNLSTIMRDGTESPGAQPARDGQWQHADADWTRAQRPSAAASLKVSACDCPSPSAKVVARATSESRNAGSCHASLPSGGSFATAAA